MKKTFVCLVRKIILLLIISTVFLTQQLTAQDTTINFSYPPLIAGSSWGAIFQRYYINGDYDAMLRLTSEESIKQYGPETIRKYYQTMKFGYTIKLKSWSRQGKYYILNYESNIYATREIVRLKLISAAKGDSAKLVLPYNFQYQETFLYH